MMLNTKPSFATQLKGYKDFEDIHLDKPPADHAANHIKRLCVLAAQLGFGSMKVLIPHTYEEYTGEHYSVALVLEYLGSTGLHIQKGSSTSKGVLFNIGWDNRLGTWDGNFPSHLPQLM